MSHKLVAMPTVRACAHAADARSGSYTPRLFYMHVYVSCSCIRASGRLEPKKSVVLRGFFDHKHATV